MKKAILLLALSLFFNNIFSQENNTKRVSGEFKDVSLVEFFQLMEQVCSCRFYYNEQQLDSVSLHFTANNELLTEVLEKALKNTDLLFSIDDQQRIFITKGLKITTALPKDFFSKTIDKDNQASDSLVDYEISKLNRGKVLSENKLHEVGTKTTQFKGDAIITGYIRNAKTGEPLVNTSVFIDNEHFTLTDAYGFYSLTVPSGQHTLNILALGMKDTRLQLAVYSDGKMNIDIPEQVTTLKEVIVSSRKTINVNRVQMGVEKLNIESIKRMPSLFGEADLLRVITSLPGVKT